MPQVTLYLDEETDALARRAAADAGVSYSRWVSDLIRARSSWPRSVLDLAGSIADFPTDTHSEKSDVTGGRQPGDRPRVSLED